MRAPNSTKTVPWGNGPNELAPCGTETAYRRHLRENERRRKAGLPKLPIDEACRDAHRASSAVSTSKARQVARAARIAVGREPRLPDHLGHYDEEWRPQALCRYLDDPGHNPFDHLGAHPSPQHVRAARDFCARCPVIQRCADEADRYDDPGVWAGSYRNGGARFYPLIEGAPERRYPSTPPPRRVL